MVEEVILEINGKKYVDFDYHIYMIKKLTRELAKYEEKDWYRESCKWKNKLKEERRKHRTWEHVFISDIHAGSIYFDAPAFKELVRKLEEEKIRCRVLHILGDVVEGKYNHTGQLYEAFPFQIQRSIAVKAVLKLVNVLKPYVVNIIPGNHDRKYSFNLLDTVVEDLREKLSGNKIQLNYYRDDEYYVYENILALHGVTRSAGSDYTGLTPLILNNLIALAIEHNVNYIILGHYHRAVIIQYMNKLVIALPSFQYASKPLRNERGILLLRNNEFKLVTTKPSERKELIEYWRKAVKI